MKEINLPSGNYLFVEVLDNASDFHYDSWFTRYINHSKGSIKLDVNTKIISTTKDITEEQADSILETSTKGLTGEKTWRDYNYPEWEECFDFKESLQSLIQANGLDVNKNYLILLKK